MNPLKIFILPFLAALILPTYGSGQEKFKGRIVDAKTKKGIKQVFWKVIDSDLEGYTNKSGKFSFNYEVQPNIHLGHQAYHLDTIINYKSEETISLRRIFPDDIIPVISNFERGQKQNGNKVGIWPSN